MQKVTSRMTKTEIIKAYNELAKQYKALKAEKGAAPAAAPARAAAARPGPARETGELTVTDIVERLGSLTARIGESSSTLQNKLTTEATILDDLRSQADAHIKTLKDLHGLDVGDNTLADLIQEYSQTADEAEKELAEKKKAFADEMDAKRAEWKKEQDLHDREIKERNAALKKARQRNSQEYKYDLERTHAREEDDFAQANKEFDRELAELAEKKQAEWTEREKQLAEREKEYTELKAKSEAFPDELEQAKKKAESEGANIARRQNKAETDLQKKDYESQRRVNELKIQSLEATIEKQERQLEALSKQLEGARHQTTELAVKAIEGASNASSFAAIKEIALEQAKHSPKGK